MSDDDKPGVRKAYQADYKSWLQKDQWNVVEAAMLLAGFEPEAFPNGDSHYSDLASQTDGIHRLIADDISAKKLSFKNPPGIWIAWFKQTGLPLPSELDGVLFRQNHQTPPAVPVVTVGASGGNGEGWKEMACVEARKIIEQRRTQDLYPSQETIADEIAKKFRADGVMGAGGKPLTGAYIKRHALKGISSARGKQLSTPMRRGK